jgi:Ribbon-helix-helix protein, copG family
MLSAVKRLQILIEADLDEALANEARRLKTSKGALLRRYAREALRPLPPLAEDPIWQLAGTLDFEPADVDETVYG